jgi:hypothetical protein
VIIGIISDTHSNLKMLHEAADRLVEQYQPDLFLHLGDNYSDGEELGYAGHTVRTVPGTRCAEYLDARFPTVRVEAFAGITIAYGHVAGDILPHLDDAAIVLHGHSHRARIEWEDGRLWMNPGHFRSRNDRGMLPSYGVIQIDADAVTLTVHERDGAIRYQERVPREQLAAGS